MSTATSDTIISNLLHLKIPLLPYFLIEKVDTSADFSHHIMTQYKKLTPWPHLKNPPVEISHTTSPEKKHHLSGEANLIKKIHELWQEDTSEILVQLTISPKETYHVLTEDPGTGDKSKIIIETKQDQWYIEKHHPPQNPTLNKLTSLSQKISNFYFKPLHLVFIKDQKDKIFFSKLSFFKESTKSNIEKSPIIAPILLKGQIASPGISHGRAVIVHSPDDLIHLHHGDILVTKELDSSYQPGLQRASGIITEQTGQTKYAAIISRDLEIPCLIASKNATTVLNNDQNVILDATTGQVHPSTSFSKIKTKPIKHQISKTATKIFISVSQPELAHHLSLLALDGALISPEYIISHFGIHPKHIIQENQNQDFIKYLLEQVSKFTQSFYQKPTIYQLSNFSSADYKNLSKGHLYEEEETNPSLGLIGSSKHLTSPQVLNLELEVIKQLRNKLGHKNLHLALPTTRSVQELLQIKKHLLDFGLTRSPSFNLYLTISTPENILNIASYIKQGVDGLIVNYHHLNSLVAGFDPEHTTPFYSITTMDLVNLLTKESKKEKIPLLLTNFASNTEVLESAVLQKIYGVSVSAKSFEMTQELITSFESKL